MSMQLDAWRDEWDKIGHDEDYARPARCPNCGAALGWRECPECGGNGETLSEYGRIEPCPVCDGDGWIDACPECDGPEPAC